MSAARKKPSGHASQNRSMTDVEWAIIEAVWQHEPCAAGTVQEALAPSHGWAYSTVKTTMDRMVAKGLLESEAIRNLQLFRARVSRQDASRGELRRLLGRAFDGALAPLIQFIVEEEKLSSQELDQLRDILKRANRSK